MEPAQDCLAVILRTGAYERAADSYGSRGPTSPLNLEAGRSLHSGGRGIRSSIYRSNGCTIGCREELLNSNQLKIGLAELNVMFWRALQHCG